MRVMVIIKATKESEAGIMPEEKLLTDMGQYNEALAQAGILLAGEGLQPSAKGARVLFSSTERKVVHGPFPAPHSLVAGFWLWQVTSMEEALEWVKRCPNPMLGESEIEIRPIFEAEDFGDAMSPALRAQEDELRARLAQKQG